MLVLLSNLNLHLKAVFWKISDKSLIVNKETCVPGCTDTALQAHPPRGCHGCCLVFPQVPCYSYGQKLSKLAILRIACNYILSLAQLADMDYTPDHSNRSFTECVEQCTRTLQAEGRSKKRKVGRRLRRGAFEGTWHVKEGDSQPVAHRLLWPCGVQNLWVMPSCSPTFWIKL